MVLSYTSYKEHCDLYIVIQGSIVVNSCQIKLTLKDIILLSEVSVVIYKAPKCTRMENDKFIHFNLSVGTYSIDNFNAKIKMATLQQRQDWEPPQIQDLKLVIPEDYTFIASNYCTGHTRRLSWKYYANQGKAISWLMQNISWYTTSSNIIVTALQTNQQN